MSGPVWRAILWVERFLPTPRPVPAATERSKANGWVMLVPLFAVLPTVMTVLLRRRPALAEFARHNRVAFEELALVVTGCVILATIGCAIMFGARAWRDAKGVR